MFTGNKGEWSEIYVFLKLLADGKLNAANANLEVLKSIYYPIIKIFREETYYGKKEYCLNGNIKIIDSLTNQILLEIKQKEFINKSILLLKKILEARGRSFTVAEIEDFLTKIKISSLTAKKTDKSDIRLVVHDLRTGLNPTLGFSIKSMLGKNSTLFNPGNTTNFIYIIDNEHLTNEQINQINQINSKPVISSRIKRIRQLGADLKYFDIESESLKLNLQLIDSRLPEIIGYLLIYNYELSIHKSVDLLKKINLNNPIEYNQSYNHPFYEYKLKSFLTDSALGMTPSSIWNGKYDATGGLIIVKQNGELVCYHIYNRNEFQEYLLNNTRFEQASITRYNFGKIYEEKGIYLIKLNLQVRFIN